MFTTWTFLDAHIRWQFKSFFVLLSQAFATLPTILPSVQIVLPAGWVLRVKTFAQMEPRCQWTVETVFVIRVSQVVDVM